MSQSSSSSAMLTIPEKKGTPVDLYSALLRHISSHYPYVDPRPVEDDLRTLQSLRSDLLRPSPPPSPSLRRDLLLRYSRALSAALPRFPSLPNHFTFHDAFRPPKRGTAQGLPFERAAALFNLSSAYSEIAAAADRSGEEGRKLACNSFQAAAGTLAYLRGSAEGVGATTTTDMTAECVGMLERLMLAQAQECFFEKVIADGKGPAICSKVARQVSLYYEDVSSSLNLPLLHQHFDKAWISHVQLKAALFYAEACYRAALDLHEKEAIGEEIARLKDGIKVLGKAKKSVKGGAATLSDAVGKLENIMNSNLVKALKENDQVYLVRVPEPESLAPLPGVSLVKPMVMDELLDPSKERLFTNLVPDDSAKAVSRYTEMVDDIIRTQAEKLQQESELTRVKLKEMDLPDSILALEGNLCLPVDLKEDVEAVQVVGGPVTFEADLKELRDLKTASQSFLIEIEDMLEKEERDDDRFRTQFGTRWTRPPSKTLTKTLYERLNKFAATIKQAAASDANIERAVNDNLQVMEILNNRPIESAIPNLGRPIMSLDVDEDAIVGALKQSLRRLEALGAERAGLEDMLKEMKRKDDILPKLMATTGSHEDLFKKEISKYDSICEDIVQNIRAQEILLHEIQAQNDKFSAVFNLEDYKVKRERIYKQIAAAVAKFREIKGSINEGLKFYITLQDAITNVKQQCSDFVMTRSMECKETIQDVQAKIATMDISSDRRSVYNYPSSGHNPPISQQPDRGSAHPHQLYPQAPPTQQFDPRNGQPNHPYYQATPPQPQTAQDGQPNLPYYPAPPPQRPNAREGQTNQPYYHAPPPQPQSAWDGQPNQPYYQAPPPPQLPNARDGQPNQPYYQAPPPQLPNARDGQPNQQYHLAPPSQKPESWNPSSHQPYYQTPPLQRSESWNAPPRQPYPQPAAPYYQPSPEQRYSQPPYTSSYAPIPQPPSYASSPGSSYQPPPPTRPDQRSYHDYGRPANPGWGASYYSPPHPGAPVQQPAAQSGVGHYPPYHGGY